MHILLLAGLGPTFKNAAYLQDTILDPEHGQKTATKYLDRTEFSGFQLDTLGFSFKGKVYPLLRPRYQELPHLTTFTLEAILEHAGVTFEHYDTTRVWEEDGAGPAGDYDAVFLSTSYIWTWSDLKRMLDWIEDRLPGVPLVVGGQFSNLKYAALMKSFPRIDYIVRGDGERAIPELLRVLAGRGSIDAVPNLVRRDGRNLIGYTLNKFEYLDLEAYPTPSLSGHHPYVPYESMRGCPFSCKFCSYPAASPKWRYKSATKIRDDWARYADENGTTHISAMDSTFTVPPTRLRELLKLLPDLNLTWEGYSRANALKTQELVDAIEATNCRFLSIGFESMSDRTLKFMNKRVTRDENLRAFRLLSNSDLGHRCSFMAGYPGETPDDFALTRDFLVNEYAGIFMLSVFGVSDETMPLWEDKEELQIVIKDPANPEYSWSHIGMDVHEARRLNYETLDEVRAKNDNAVVRLWQPDYHLPMPQLDRKKNVAIEKAVERIGMTPRDYPEDPQAGAACIKIQLGKLRDYGIDVFNPQVFTSESLFDTSSLG